MSAAVRKAARALRTLALSYPGAWEDHPWVSVSIAGSHPARPSFLVSFGVRIWRRTVTGMSPERDRAESRRRHST